MSVKRYIVGYKDSASGRYAAMLDKQDGGYVTYEDYAALEARCAAQAAENAGLKAKGREVFKEAAYVYSHYNRMVDHLDGESVDGQTLHEFQEVIEKGTPATDAYMSERGE